MKKCVERILVGGMVAVTVAVNTKPNSDMEIPWQYSVFQMIQNIFTLIY